MDSISVTDETAVLSAVHDVSVSLRDAALRIEQARRVPEDVMAMVKDTGLFKLVQPRMFGGLQSKPTVMIEALSQLATGCASTAWVSAVCGLHPWMIGTFPLQAQQDIWGDDPDTIVSGSYAPSAMAEAADGGIRVSGVWQFASGYQNAQWALLGVWIPDEDQPSGRHPAFMLVPMADIEIEDMWHAVGLTGSGSNNLHLTDVFVPGHRVMSFADMSSGASPGAEVHGDVVFNIPFLSVVPYSIASVALGAAKGALDGFVDITAERETRGGTVDGGNKVGGFPIVQSRVAEAAASIQTGLGLLRHDLSANVAAAETGEGLTVTRRIENRRNQAMAMRLAVEAVNALFSCVGGAGLLLDHPVQRAWRDVNATARHAGLNWDVQTTLSGRHALGYDVVGGF